MVCAHAQRRGSKPAEPAEPETQNKQYMMPQTTTRLMALAVLLIAGMVMGGEPAPGYAVPSRSFAEDIFQHGASELALTSGALFSPLVNNGKRPVIDFTITELQYGYMLGSAKGTGWLRGNWEVLGEGFGGAVFTSNGSYIAGMTGLLRYNFVPRTGRFAPFAQGGLGVTFTDIDRDIVGQTFNFNLDIGIGLRYLVARDCSVNLEYRLQHTSNADLAPVNEGINAWGPILGVSFYF